MSNPMSDSPYETYLKAENEELEVENKLLRERIEWKDDYIAELEAENAKLKGEAAKWRKRANEFADADLPLKAELKALRELVKEAGEAFEAASEGNGINFHAYALDMKAALEKTNG